MRPGGMVALRGWDRYPLREEKVYSSSSGDPMLFSGEVVLTVEVGSWGGEEISRVLAASGLDRIPSRNLEVVSPEVDHEPG